MNVIEELEALRSQAKRKRAVALSLMGAGFVLFLLFWPLGILVFIAGVIAMLLSHTKQSAAYARAYKEKLVTGFLAARIDDLHFDPDRGVEESAVRSTNMMHMGNLYSANDLIEGSYKGVRLSQSDVQIQQRTGSGKSSTTRTYLLGRWMVFSFDRPFACNLQVRDRNFRNAKNSGGRGAGRGKTVELETGSVAFDEAFRVFAVSEDNARKMLTPQLMEALLQARAQADGPMLFCFVGSELHVAVNNRRDSFEPPVWKPIDPNTVGREIVADVKLITDLIDTLCIDSGLFGEDESE